MTNAFLGLGSNRGDREGFLDAAIAALQTHRHCELIGKSSFYETPPMGPQDQDAYLNMAAQITTDLSPDALLDELQAIEQQLGRLPADQRQRWGPRKIDIDLLLYDGQVIDTPKLTVPHPGMHERWFVLRPLADIAPSAMHPTLGKTIAQLFAELDAATASIQEAAR